jgi:adenylate cyclase
MVFAGTWLRPFQALLLGLLALLGLIAMNMALLQAKHMMLPLAAPAVCLMSVFVCQMIYGYFIESRGRRQISNLFSYYVPPELVQKMAENPGAFSMAPLQREMTVLFSDVRGFTSIAEKLSPHDLADLINAYLSAMSQVIREEHHGTLDKYIGDAIMAFWGAPVADAAHAENAVLAALQMQQVAQRLRGEFLTKGWPELRIGIGLNSGQMRVGDMGSNIRKAYTAMGDEVNLGARLEGLTKIYGVDILMGENTHSLLRGWVNREVDSVRVKGKKKPIAIYEPLHPAGMASDALSQELQQWHQALSAYRTQQWPLAQNLLESLLSAHPESVLYALYQKRISEFIDTPPAPYWDGATNFELK